MKRYIQPSDDRMFRPHSSIDYNRPMARYRSNIDTQLTLKVTLIGLALLGLAWGLSEVLL